MLAAIDDAMACGFDGVYLDIVDGFETYEQNGEDFIDDRMNPETKHTYRRDMVDWVKAIAARARAKNSAALIIPQNGSQLVANGDFVEVISAIGIEDLFANGKKLQPASHTDEILGHLKKWLRQRSLSCSSNIRRSRTCRRSQRNWPRRTVSFGSWRIVS